MREAGLYNGCMSSVLDQTTLSAAQRRPRFKRLAPPPLRLTDDDIVMLRHTREHRFVRSIHLVKLMGRSSDKILRRLAVLYHNGYLDRPLAQLDLFSRSGSAPLIYALGNKGAIFDEATGIDWTDKNREVKRPYIEHALMVADFMVDLQCALQGHPNIRFIHARDFMRRAWTMTTVVPGTTVEIALTPDKVFALEFVDTGRRNL